MKTHADATQYITEAIGSEFIDAVDVDAILDEVYDILGHWDFAQLDADTTIDFWDIVAKHDAE